MMSKKERYQSKVNIVIAFVVGSFFGLVGVSINDRVLIHPPILERACAIKTV